MIVETKEKTTGSQVFRVGDKVRLLRAAKSRENGWGNVWIRQMDAAVGKIGTVDKFIGSLKRNVRVNFPEVDGVCGYPDFALEKVEELTATTDQTKLRIDPILASKFNIGDKVRVNYIDWPSSPYEGQIAEVVGNSHGYVKVRFKNNITPAVFPQRLTLVESKATITGLETAKPEIKVETKPVALTASDFKAGDRVLVKYGWGWDGPATVVRLSQFGPVSVKPDHRENIGSFGVQYLTKLPSTTPVASKVFDVALAAAIELSKRNGITNADEVQAAIVRLGFSSAQLGNAAGAIFRGKNWTKVGSIKSNRSGNHSRTINTWKYIGA